MSELIIKTIEKSASAEIIEKKSKFIANLFAINSVNEAEKIIKETKKKYRDARHNCFAFTVFEENKIVSNRSDDGEPSGTAGEPILNVITKNNLCNVLIIVTRYFGGILLGTGGLTRAYTNASLKALNNVEIINKEYGTEAIVQINYTDNEKFRYFCNKNKINITCSEYKETIFYNIELNDENLEKIQNLKKEENSNNNINIKSFVEKSRKLIKKEE